MNARDDLTEELHLVPREALEAFLVSRSGLPGPRANLELADAFATIADRRTILRFASLDDEYLRFCGTEALGSLLCGDEVDAKVEELLRRRAADDLWRVREGAARALQLVGDRRPDRLRSIVAHWTAGDDPAVRRAAVAAICEPRLLSDPATRSTAVDACSSSTAWIVSLPVARRKDKPVRDLRQALGYCWSVVVAAAPEACFPAFEAVAALDDPDARWIVASNLKKARLQRVLDRHGRGTSIDGRTPGGA